MNADERAGLWLEVMLSYIRKISDSLATLTIADFVENDELVDATAFRLMQIGELAGRLPHNLREHYPHIDWIKIKAFRNLVAHEYHRASLTQIFAIATGSLQPLREMCEVELERQDG